MKKKICFLLAAALFCAGALYGCSDSGNADGSKGSGKKTGIVSSEPFTPHRFGKSDLTVNGSVTLGMTVEDVKEALGQPDNEETFGNDDFIYGTYTTMKYDNLTLTFYDVMGGKNFLLGSINSDSEDDLFAGGLHVGSTVDEVLTAFTQDEERAPLYYANFEESYGDYIYGDYTRDNFLERRPKGVIEYAFIDKWAFDNGYMNEYTLQYYYADQLTWSEDETAYSGDLYSMIFYVDSDTELVKSIMLSYDLAS